ncbi:MAG: GNAT family N-acetyltransferase [bacterium]|nr:GNAT family N-acetyltransferase [bacterium]
MLDLKSWLSTLTTGESAGFEPPGLPLRGERVIIRPFTRADEDRRQGWCKYQDPYLSKYNFQPQGTAANDLTFQRLQDRLRFAVDDHQDELIGYLSLKPAPRRQDRAELGMCFAADQVSRGNGAEALDLLLPWAYRTLDLQFLTLEVDAINERAIRLYRSLRFKKTGEKWQKENNPSLQDFFIRHGFHPGSRCRVHQLELLSWKMERPRDLT